MMERRQFLRQLGLYLSATGFTCAGCNAAFGQWPGTESSSGDGSSPWPSENSPSGDVSVPDPASPGMRRFQPEGCSLSAEGANAFQSGIRFLHGTGNPQLDQMTYEELNVLAGHIGGFQPGFAFLDDAQGKNAFASPHDVTGAGSPHGAVLLGVRLMFDFLGRPGASSQFANLWSVAAIMAHEWAHIAQFNYRVQSADGRVVGQELMADMISGWYLAKKLQLVGQMHGPWVLEQYGLADQTAAVRAIFSIGDTNYNSPQHHGTGEQRVAAFVSGHEFGMLGGTFEHVFTRSRQRYMGS